MKTSELLLAGAGYAASVPVVTRFVPVVRERRWRWLAAHHLGMVALLAVFASRRSAVGMAANGSWLVISSAWYGLGGRRLRGAPPPRTSPTRDAMR